MDMKIKYFDLDNKLVNIRCKLYYNDTQNIRTVVLFGHGLSGHKDNRAAERFAGRLIGETEDAAVLAFNWPGHGDDEQEVVSLSTCDKYIDALIKYIKETFAPEVIDVYATSFGGYLFLRYIAEHENPFQRIALRAPAVEMNEVMNDSIMKADDKDRLRGGKRISVGFDRKVQIDQNFISELQKSNLINSDFRKWAENILILQGSADEVVPYEAVSRFAEKNEIQFELVEGADHRFTDVEKMEEAISQILDFFKCYKIIKSH
jgi:hypothetical protein